MSIFEDPLDIHYNANTRIEGVPHINTIKTALDRIAVPPDDVAILLDWESLDAIAHPLDVEPELTGHVPREHVELRPDKISLALECAAFVHGVAASNDFGVLLDAHAVRLDGSIINHDKVVAIDFETHD